ncbi:hypothetical protein MSG28_001513 [Choristoneura fumiferana]|uniref:Uncharacterized protein n=1 Tax=Choristoneura fumiferana TaxID=7141 RepID=A0ACC0KV94_CHOFU|nr:hypothetical protein MSG28_001513 [Choristoneura fumiferana]
MAMKEWLQRLPPPRSLLALLLATGGFSGRLFASHVTQSPTLVVDTCHALCRLVGLITTLIAYKFERADENAGREGKLRNTFGWARIEVVGRLSVHVLFASFALTLVVNALQLGVHSSHVPMPRYPKIIILIHFVFFDDIGRELSYSRRLSMTESGGVVVKTGVGEPILAHAPTDIASSLFVMGAGLTAEWEAQYSGIADPALSAVAAIVLVIFNFPFSTFRTTVPEGLGTCELKAAALRVPGVLAIHELHVWQLHRDRVVATAHVAYSSHEDYLRSSELVCDVFKRHGIGLVTLQPEFMFHVVGTEEERKALIDLANEACATPCAKECVAPRCCQPPPKPQVSRV